MTSTPAVFVGAEPAGGQLLDQLEQPHPEPFGPVRGARSGSGRSPAGSAPSAPRSGGVVAWCGHPVQRRLEQQCRAARGSRTGRQRCRPRCRTGCTRSRPRPGPASAFSWSDSCRSASSAETVSNIRRASLPQPFRVHRPTGRDPTPVALATSSASRPRLLAGHPRRCPLGRPHDHPDLLDLQPTRPRTPPGSPDRSPATSAPATGDSRAPLDADAQPLPPGERWRRHRQPADSVGRLRGARRPCDSNADVLRDRRPRTLNMGTGAPRSYPPGSVYVRDDPSATARRASPTHATALSRGSKLGDRHAPNSTRTGVRIYNAEHPTCGLTVRHGCDSH